MTNVQSVDRISAILNTIANHQGTVTVTDIAQQINLPVSTVSRFLIALENVEYVSRTSAEAGYRIGPAVYDLATRSDFSRYLAKIAQPAMVKLSEVTGESVTLTVLQNEQVFCLAQQSGRYHLQLQDWTGRCFPLHASADGKIYLAHMSESQRNNYLSHSLTQLTACSIIDPAELRRQCRQIQISDYAETSDEFEEGLVTLATPIRSANGQVIGAVGLGGPSFRLGELKIRQQIRQSLLDTGIAISAHLQ